MCFSSPMSSGSTKVQRKHPTPGPDRGRASVCLLFPWQRVREFAVKPILRVENLTKIYPGSGIIKRYPVKALDSISFTVEEGDIFGLVGESGSGKTTLARCILFLEPPTSGKVYYGNLCLNDVPWYRWKRLRSRMQSVFRILIVALNPRHSHPE